MPTLNCRADDGGYYIRHLYRDHNTWQITGDGVRFLRRRHVTEHGQSFSTDLFMELWRRSLIYYGREIPQPPAGRSPYPEQPQARSLWNRAEEFYSVVFAGDVSRARGFLIDDISPASAIVETHTDEFADQVRRLRSKPWRVVDVRVFAFPLIDEDRGRTYAIGTTYVRVHLTDGGPMEHELTQAWLNHNDEWFLESVDFKLPDAA